MRVLAIDPGPRTSGVVLLDTGPPRRVTYAEPDAENDALLTKLIHVFGPVEAVVVEAVAHYGMPVGRDVFGTVFWSGRFCQQTKIYHPGTAVVMMDRRRVKMCLCNSAQAKDANIRQALIDKFQPIGGGKIPQIGTKKQPGPLYGVKSHCWSALALAVTYLDRPGERG